MLWRWAAQVGQGALVWIHIFQKMQPTASWFINSFAESLFPEIQLEIEVAYFGHDCTSLTERQKQQIGEEFLDLLESEKICILDDQIVCLYSDVTMSCGEEADSTSGKKKRSIFEGVFIRFRMATTEISVGNCTEQCGSDAETYDEACWNQCEGQLIAQGNSTLEAVAVRLEELCDTSSLQATATPGNLGEPSPPILDSSSSTHESSRMSITLSDVTLVPMRGVHRLHSYIECGSGMFQIPNTMRCGEFIWMPFVALFIQSS